MLLNLLSKAVKFNRQDGTVSVSWKQGAAGRLLLKVSDSGIGMTLEQMGRLFELFDRLGAEQSEVESTGLGLALSRSLAEAVAGSLTAKSTPREKGASSPSSSVSPSRRSFVTRASRELKPSQEPKGENCRLLCIEDGLPNLLLIQMILASRDTVELRSAKQGWMGIDLARGHHPRLILLDLHLPDRPGEAALRELGRDLRTADIQSSSCMRMRHRPRWSACSRQVPAST
jgi:hypothetical protein